PGDSFTMKVDVKNRGNVASAATKVYFYLHKDTAEYSAASKIGEADVPAINPGQTIADLTLVYAVPVTASEGNYYFSYWVDAPNLVVEGREDDNQGVWSVAISNAADLLSPNNSISPLSGLAGDTFTMSVDVKNRGNSSAVATKVFFYLHKDTVDYSLASKIGEAAVPALAAGQTAAGLTFSYQVPLGTPSGNYYFSYFIDPENLVLGANRENNQGFWANLPILEAAPDLLSPGNSISPLSGLVGDTFTMSMDVKNRGNAPAVATKVFFYLHKDSADYSLASKIGEVDVPALAAGETAAGLTFNYPVPAGTPSGNYFFSYFIDPDNLVQGADRANNQGFWANVPIFASAPDLLTANSSISPLSGVPGDTFTMSVDVKNRGTANAVATTIRFYFHKDAADYSSVSQIGEVQVPALAAGATAPGLTLSYVVPAGTAAGNYFFSYWIDAASLLLEASEENNRSAWNIPIVNAPDLFSPNNSIIPTSGFAGESFTMTLDVKNQGTTASDASKVRFYMHQDTADYSAASQIGEIDLPPLAASATASGLTFSYTVPLGTAGGNYQFCYWIDAPGLVAESREENNPSCWVNIEILKAPDLLPLAATVSPAAVQAGSALALTFDVKNQGNEASPAGTVSIYMHIDSPDYSTNSWIAEIALPALNAGMTASGLTFAYTPPPNTVPGDYQFCLWIDATGLITESVENNNGTCAALVSILPAPPQITVQPKSLYTKAGGSATFSLTAVGTLPLSYQWQFNGANIANATGASMTLNNVLTNWSGQYRAIVTNPVGLVTSDEVTLTVYVHEPALFSSVSLLPDGSIQMLLTGEPALNYQVQISSNLTAWTLWTNVVLSTNGSTTLIDAPGSGVAQRFYRAMEAP
ncbi:MAG: hypothetical protein HY674_02825, partial [Chloroflexi bacterium]|nr:hypothetical protein [Chloroflexota bacterium]